MNGGMITGKANFYTGPCRLTVGLIRLILLTFLAPIEASKSDQMGPYLFTSTLSATSIVGRIGFSRDTRVAVPARNKAHEPIGT